MEGRPRPASGESWRAARCGPYEPDSKKGAIGPPSNADACLDCADGCSGLESTGFSHPGLRTALEQAASGPARPYAKAGSNLAALIADERALVGQCPRSFRHRLQRPFDLGLRVGGAQHRPDKRRKGSKEPAWRRVTKLLHLVTDQVFERESSRRSARPSPVLRDLLRGGSR